MITHIDIENFRGLKSVKADLKPLTILIGANDTGKSAFLAALQHFATGESLDSSDYWRFKAQNVVRIVAEIKRPDGTIFCGEWKRNHTNLGPVGFYQLPCNGATMTSEGYADNAGAGRLAEDGSGVPSLMDHLLRRDRVRYDQLGKLLCKLVPGLENIEVRTPQANQRKLFLVVEKGLSIPAEKASAGVRLLIFFAALAYHPTPPNLILLEEPETGIHPKRLGDVMNLLRDITQGKHGGHAAQVVLTTHSPYLLDLVNLETDQVLVFRREEDGSRTCEAANAERLKQFLDEFMLGEVWYNQGEEGLVARPS